MKIVCHEEEGCPDEEGGGEEEASGFPERDALPASKKIRPSYRTYVRTYDHVSRI